MDLLLRALCEDIISKEVLIAMHFNDGVGISDPNTCQEIATRLDDFIDTHDESVTLTSKSLSKDSVGCLVLSDKTSVDPADPCYEATPDELRDFAKFLRDCGGFSVC